MAAGAHQRQYRYRRDLLTRINQSQRLIPCQPGPGIHQRTSLHVFDVNFCGILCIKLELRRIMCAIRDVWENQLSYIQHCE